MKNNISLLIGLKNNLDYTKHFYETTRKLYPTVEICFASYGSTDGTHEWLDSLADNNVKYYYSNETKTFSDTFNKATELATSDYVAYLHNDIVIAKGFIENIMKHVEKGTVVSYTTVEPPIFAPHERPGKLVRGFGTDLKSFEYDNFMSYANTQSQKYSNTTSEGITFFMCIDRMSLLEIGGMDNLFNPMFCEDDDLIKRLTLLGFKQITSLDAICYHFVSKTSRFSDEYKTRTRAIELSSNRNFVRKWGFRVSKYNKKYDVGFVIKNCNMNLIDNIEPWCSTMYVDCDYSEYIEKEQPNTKYDLHERIKPYDNEKQNCILVNFDGNHFTKESFDILFNLSDIISESGEVGSFELDIFQIEIVNLDTFEKTLLINNEKIHS